MKRRRTDVKRKADHEREIGNRRGQEPEGVDWRYLLQRLNHIVRRGPIRIDQLGCKVKEDGLPSSRHLLGANEVNGYPANCELASVSDALEFIHDDSNVAFDTAASDEQRSANLQLR
jgi:hypothetical protein